MNFHDTAKTTTCDALLDLIDGGSGNPTGRMILKNAGATTLVFLAFSATAFAASAIVSGEAKAVSNAISNGTGPTPGTIASGAFINKAGTEIISFTVSDDGTGELDISDTVIPGGTDTVVCTSLEFHWQCEAQ